MVGKTKRLMNYELIKFEAKRLGCRVTDLIALASQNDPFYVGTPFSVALANWFAELWERFGYTNGVHLRRIHYRLISQEKPVNLPNGTPYANTNNCWSMLDLASKYARYTGKVDPRAFDDRRNGRPIINMEMVYAEPEIDVFDPSSEFDFKLPSFPAYPHFDICGYEPDQRYHLEIWAEKSTMNDILEPLCRSYGANLITGVGELSITSVVWLIDRLSEFQKPCRIFYISDFDPAGQSMPVAVARKIEKFIHDSDNHYDARLFPLVLSHEQCNKYSLPRTPIKNSELRAGKFQEQFGEGATELDALEALYPGELHRILSNAMSNYRDRSIARRVSQAENATKARLQDLWESILQNYQDGLDDIEAEYLEIKREFNGRIASLLSRIKDTWQAISDELQDAALDIEPYPIPVADESEDLTGCLYDSNNEYFEQLKNYKNFQNTGTCEPETASGEKN
jgi:hypothetical protein